MKTPTNRIVLLPLITLLLGAQPSMADSLLVQGIVGATRIDDDNIQFKKVKGLDEELQDEINLPTMFTLGAAGQQSFGDIADTTHFGFEYGLLVSFAKKDSRFRSTGEQTIIVIDTALILGDFFLGVFLSQDFGDVLRIYAGAGPLIMIGSIDGEFEDEDPSIRNVQEKETSIGAGGYARAGIEFAIDQGGTFGIGGRVFTATLDFDDTLGEVDFEGVQGFITYTKDF